MPRPPRETRSRQCIADSDQCSEYSSTSHHSSYDLGRHVMSTINITHEMVEIKEQLARSAAIRAHTRQREKEAEEETAHSHLRLNNLEIVLLNVQRDTERKLKRACLHSECEFEPAVEKQQREWHEKRHMPPPPNPLETTGRIDDASGCQHRSRAEEPTGETRSLLQTIREQIVSDVEANTASTGLELEAEHWQRKEAAAARRYTRALELRAQLAEEAVG
jgi:cell division protein ZapA (FtsZ GTPase activity inhibitor)